MNEELQFQVIEKYIQDKGIVTHLLNSFNQFIDDGIQKIINEENTITIKTDSNMIYRYTFGEVYVTKPVIIDDNRIFRKTTPLEARFKDFTYEGNLLIDIYIDVMTEDNVIVESDIIRKFQLAKIPIMLGSNRCVLNDRCLQSTKPVLASQKYKDNYGECFFEVGGYFIIRGKERVLISQERSNYNTIISSIDNDTGGVNSEIRSISYETGHSVLIECILNNSANNIIFIIPFIKEKLSVGIIFQALGVHGENLEKLLKPDYLMAKMDERQTKQWNKIIKTIINDTKFIQTSEECPDLQEATIQYLVQFILHTTDKPSEYVKQVLQHEIFPHLGGCPEKTEYTWMLANIVIHTICVYLKIEKPDSKDHLINKRIECAGTLLHDLFRTSFKRFIRSLVPYLEKYQNIQHVIQRVNNITKDIKYCFLTGNWGLQKNSYVKTGVSQIFSRLSYMASLSHLRRINMHIGKEVKNSDLRQIHQSTIFFVDPAETPEGVCVGIVKNFALTSTITTYTNFTHLKQIIEGMMDITTNVNHVPIILNNIKIGHVECVDKFLTQFRELRDHKIINYQVSISFNTNKNHILIWSDAGRYIRPLFVLPQCMNKTLLSKCHTFDDYLDNNVIRYLDASELEMSLVAMNIADVTKQHHYLELHPTCILGVIGCTIPFPDHNQAPRVCYYSSMAKQTMGIYATNLPIRIDTITHVLDYVQKPLVSTRVARMLNNDKMASGINCIMAIANYTGLNQEDCVIVNKNALERGLFVSHSYRTVIIDEKRTDSYTSFVTCVPQPEYMKPNYNYHKLDANGIVRKGLFVDQNDVLVGRLLKKNTRNKETFSDASIVVNMKEEGIVDDIFILNSPDGHRIIKIRIRSLKFPELGDKVAQVSGQKGTIGLVCPQEDMPFTSEGIVPDIIVNSHAIPSRMTISMLLEVVLGKACCMNGESGDATPFSSSSIDIVEKLCDNLEECGFERTGYEVMYNGMTGERFQSQIFIGPTFYHKLKHMVSDKMYARGFGSVQMLTKYVLCVKIITNDRGLSSNSEFSFFCCHLLTSSFTTFLQPTDRGAIKAGSAEMWWYVLLHALFRCSWFF